MISTQFPDEAPEEISRGTLRQFAGLCVAIFGLLFVWSGYRHQGAPTFSAWVGLFFAAVVGLPGLVYPAIIRPIFLAAIALTQPIGHVLSMVLLGLMYYGLITPLAFVFRLARRDALARHGPPRGSYWESKNDPTDVLRYLRQYQRESWRKIKAEG